MVHLMSSLPIMPFLHCRLSLLDQGNIHFLLAGHPNYSHVGTSLFGSDAKCVQLEITLAYRDQELAHLCQSQDVTALQIQEFAETISSWEFKYNSLKMEFEGKVHQLEGHIKAQEERHLVDLEKNQKEKNEALEQYNTKTTARIENYIPKLRSNHIQHTQVSWARLT
ncbi:hypothetical protein PVK06_040683 [Gossypium arboreum]|uniref:Uncharacterized protein n=1 Tax=Gossypium arboreum TaxID=29729 RepID=A0ABR0N657_GOSAR|nr:hypothetical protein PVK06_040683 [Gossypium arboreum]